MTQHQLRVLTLLSGLALSLTIFSLPTLLCLLLTGYFAVRYIRLAAGIAVSQGLIKLCPERLQHQLLHRSLFDFVCALWFEDWFIALRQFARLICKPLLQSVDPQNPAEALRDFPPEAQRLYLTKGVVRVMPRLCQQVILGSQEVPSEASSLEHEKLLREQVKLSNSERMTREESGEGRRLRRTNSQRQIMVQQEEPEWQRAVAKRREERRRPQGLIPVIQNSLGMLRRLAEIGNVVKHVQRLDNRTLFKVSLLFWLALLIQIKVNRNARKTVIKTLYVMGGVATVLGLAGTSAIIAYKHWNNRQRRDSEISEADS